MKGALSMDKEKLKKYVCFKINEYQNEIIEVVEKIYQNPETGYREKRSTQIVYEVLQKLNLQPQKNIAVTGVKAQIIGKSKKPHIAVLGELDGVICKDHPDADFETGVVHACGHNNQIGIMLGLAYGIINANIAEKLPGIIDLLAVPAEEYIELEYKKELINQDKINFYGGKQELVRRNFFENVDITIMAHSLDIGDMKDVIVAPAGSGFIYKKIEVKGKKFTKKELTYLIESIISLNNKNQKYATYKLAKSRDLDILKKELKPTDILIDPRQIEIYVRGDSIKSILTANRKLNEFLKKKFSQLSFELKIIDKPGYLPLLRYSELADILNKNLDGIIPDSKRISQKHFVGSFDIGDISHIMPVLHPFFSGVSGRLHSKDFRTTDYELAVIKPAKVLAKTVIDILWEGKTSLQKYKKAPYTINQYLKILKQMSLN